jgi:hypothetical protein
MIAISNKQILCVAGFTCLATGLLMVWPKHNSNNNAGVWVWDPGVNPDTGPYYRVYSPIPKDADAPGFSYAEATVTLQDSAHITLNPDSKSTAFIYLGGWGGKTTGGAADAGFMYNRVKKDWSPFIAYRTPKGTKFLASTLRYKAGTQAKISFSVPKDNALSLRWEGVPTDKANVTSGTIEVNMWSGYGWRADGRGCVLKRVTSIAQDPENLESGETHTDAGWQDMRIGTSADDAVAWTEEQTGGRQSYPEDGQKVTCRLGDAHGAESVTIRL